MTCVCGYDHGDPGTELDELRVLRGFVIVTRARRSIPRNMVVRSVAEGTRQVFRA